MISIYLFFSLICFGACSKKISPRIKRNRYVNDDDFQTACDLCVNLYSNLLRLINYGYTDDQIQSSLLSSCNIFSEGKASEVCDYIANTYFPVFLYLGKQGTPASNSCIKMGYCSDLENKHK